MEANVLTLQQASQYLEVSQDALRVWKRGGNNHGRELAGLAARQTPLDDLRGGLHSSDLIIIPARPAMGKTAFSRQTRCRDLFPVCRLKVGFQPNMVLCSSSVPPSSRSETRCWSFQQKDTIFQPNSSLYRHSTAVYSCDGD